MDFMKTMRAAIAVLSIGALVIGTSVADDTCPGLSMCFCNKAKTSVNCDGKQMTEVPDSIPPMVENLYLRYNKITEIRTGAFSSLSRLEHIWLNRNKVTVIEPRAFGNLSNMKSIDLRENKLSSLGQYAFSGMPTLDTVYLMTNEIQTVHETAFVETDALKNIYLQSNRLVNIPDLGTLPYLEKIVLEGNQLDNATFPYSFQSNTRLINIVLSNNNIRTLDNTTFKALQNTSLSTLLISRNKINEVTSDVFSPFHSIKSLKLGSNPLGEMPLKVLIGSLRGKQMVSLYLSELNLHGILLEDTFALLKNTSITTLNMQHNKIQVLPNNVFSGLDKLIHLDLSSCGMHETLEESFVGLDKLTFLNLQKNKIGNIPSNLPVTLEKLFLNDNQITVIYDKAFYNLRRLSELRLQHNKIQTLMQDSFLGLNRLQILSLNDNAMATLPGKVFVPLVRLETMSLAKNNLVSIQKTKGRFSSQSSLVYLDLSDNHCSYVQADFFTDMLSLEYLHMERNRLGTLLEEDSMGSLYNGLHNLKELNLMDNGITILPYLAFNRLGTMVKLNLSSNKITGWGSGLFEPMHGLQVLDLSNNLIANLNSEHLKDFPKYLTNMNLTSNPFTCDCELRWFRDWINTTSVLLTNNASYRCNGPTDWKGKPLMSFDKTQIDCNHFTMFAIFVACVVGALVVFILCTLAYRKRWWIQLYFYKVQRYFISGKRTVARVRGKDGGANDETDNKRFDAYISCSDADHKWVRDELMPGIDKGQLDDEHSFEGQFSLYFEQRDAEPGLSIIAQIFENMSASRKVIVVLSENYLNHMNKFELDLATDLMYQKSIKEIIVIHIQKGLPMEKIPKHLVSTMKRNNMLEWADSPEAKELVKKNIIESLARNDAVVDRDAE